MSSVAEFLLVEDNRAEARLAQEAFIEAGLRGNLSVVRDGREVLKFLRREGSFSAAPRPHLILLDLNLPHKDGREVLREIKSDASLRRIPVVVLTTSHAKEDIVTAYDLQANCYIAKPVDMNQFVEVLKALQKFWFTLASLPDAPETSR